MATFHFKIDDFKCSICGKPVSSSEVKLGCIAKKKTKEDDKDKITLQKNVLKAIFPNLKLFPPIKAYNITDKTVIFYGVVILHIGCNFKLEQWMQFLLGYEVQAFIRAGVGYAGSSQIEAGSDSIDMNCVICGKHIDTENNQPCFLSLWDQEEFIFCSQECIDMEEV